MSKVNKIKRGLDINLKGKAEKLIVDAGRSQTYAVKPPDFIGLTPKLLVKPDQKVKVGTPIFFDKYRPSVKFVSPVSGVVKEIVRGDRRRILDVVIEPSGPVSYEPLKIADPQTLSAEEVRDQILNAGLWPAIMQRPYGVIANPDEKPKSIFISGFDTAPLAPDYSFILKDEAASFAVGISALQTLTGTTIHLGLSASNEIPDAYAKLKGVEYHVFSGPHPAGNVGVQIHQIQPINKGDLVWTISPQHVSLIGRTFIKGHLDPGWIIALAGSSVENPRYMKTHLGASIASLVNGELSSDSDSVRIISGNVLTGARVDAQGYLGFYDSIVTVIPEGNHYEFFGWMTPGLKKFSNSRAFFSWMTPKKEFVIDSNIHGGHRAFVMTGQYDKVLPMDILPLQLLKSILVEDIDKMEQLGIYEVIEEDLALCDFVCTSKMEVQAIIRKGLDLIRKEMS